MILTDLLVAIAVALLVTALFAMFFSTRGQAWPWGSLLMVFVIVVLAAWAGGVWLAGYGPNLLGFSWLPGVAVAVFFALALAIARAPLGIPGYQTEKIRTATSRAEEATASSISLALWIIVVFLLVAIVLAYL